MQSLSRLASFGAVYALHRITETRCDASTKWDSHEKFASTSEYVVRPSTDARHSNGNDLLVVYDAKTRCAKYAIEKLMRNAEGIDDDLLDKKRPPFHAESSIAIESFRVHPREYADSTYDRGHMAPNADFVRWKELKNTSFSMANICPQATQLNRGFWSRFEAWVRHLFTEDFDELIIITGPVFAPLFINNQWIHINRTVGTFPKLIAVPTHFFKVIIGRKHNSKDHHAVGAFMVPNVNTIDSRTPLSNFVVRLDQLESIVGHRAWQPFLSERDTAMVDEVVPSGRDMARQLSAHNLKALASPKALENPQDALDPHILYVNGVYSPIKMNRVIVQAKGGKSGPLLQHLCECVDCNRQMFPKDG